MMVTTAFGSGRPSDGTIVAGMLIVDDDRESAQPVRGHLGRGIVERGEPIRKYDDGRPEPRRPYP